MSKKLFVGSLAWAVNDQDLQQLFSQYGDIEECIVVMDRFSGKSKGFGFVTFTDAAAADKAAEELNGTELKGRPVVVNEARPPRPRQNNY